MQYFCKREMHKSNFSWLKLCKKKKICITFEVKEVVNMKNESKASYILHFILHFYNYSVCRKVQCKETKRFTVHLPSQMF